MQATRKAGAGRAGGDHLACCVCEVCWAGEVISVAAGFGAGFLGFGFGVAPSAAAHAAAVGVAASFPASFGAGLGLGFPALPSPAAAEAPSLFFSVAPEEGAAAVAVPFLAASVPVSLPVSLGASLAAGGLATAVFFFASPAACDPGAGGLVPV